MSGRFPTSRWPIVLLCALLSGPATAFPAQASGSLRGVQDVSQDSVATQAKPAFFALLIGNSKYQFLNRLQTPGSDAGAMAQLLKEKYGFETQVLLDASRTDILNALVAYRKSLHENASLLIFYAGHGFLDTEADQAYWLPVDARADNNSNWISMDDITSRVRPLASKHVLVISDSCYSGAILTDDSGGHRGLRELGGGIPTEYAQYLVKMQSLASRNWMASGGMEPVADGGAPGHSIFANALLQGLQQTSDPQFSASDLFYSFVRRKVAGASLQLPQYGSIRDSGDDLGDFVFLRVGTLPGNSASALQPPVSVPQPVPDPVRNQLAPDTQSCRSQLGQGSLTTNEAYVACLRAGASAGQARAMTSLGKAYSVGLGGLPRDHAQAVSWYRKAADLGDPDGMVNLAIEYADGTGGLPMDASQALRWYTKAAHAGNSDAMMRLADLYANGFGNLPPDDKQAMSWYRKAADLGNPRAMRKLGDCYVKGSCGVVKDLSQARNWFEKAAVLGDRTAMIWLGNRYQEGTDGFPKDPVMAQQWLQKAADLQKLAEAAHQRKN